MRLTGMKSTTASLPSTFCMEFPLSCARVQVILIKTCHTVWIPIRSLQPICRLFVTTGSVERWCFPIEQTSRPASALRGLRVGDTKESRYEVGLDYSTHRRLRIPGLTCREMHPTQRA